MKRVLTFFAIIAMAMGISQSVKAQEQYDGYIDTLNNRLYYRVTDTATAVIVSPTYEYSKEDGESDYSWKMWKGYTQPSGFVLIPDSITTWNGLVLDTLPVVAIEYRTFYNCTGITSVKIPETVKDIKEAAFESCTELVTVDMPNSVERLGNAAFYHCHKLEVCHLSESLTAIPENCFVGCALKKIVFHENFESVAWCAFANCQDVDSVFFYNKKSLGSFICGGPNLRASYVYTATNKFSCQPLDVLVLDCQGVDTLDEYTLQSPGRYVNKDFIEEGPGDLRPYLKKLVLGSNLKHIRKNAFQHVDILDTLVLLPPTPPTLDEDPIWISSVLDTPVVVTPCDAEYYKVWGWSQYTYWGNYVHFLYTWDGAYTLNLRTDNREQGTAQYVTSVNCDQEISFKAVPKEHYHFVRWSDGSTDSVRTITLTQDSTLTAFFAIDTHTVTIRIIDNETMELSDEVGSVTGAGEYEWAEDTRLYATPAKGYRIVKWSCYDAPALDIHLTVYSDTTIYVYFTRKQYHAYTYVAHYSSYGTAEVDETNPFYHDTITFTATPAESMEFVGWSYNGEIVSTENPFKVEVESDTTLGAEFTYAHTDAIAEAAFANAQIFGSEKSIVVKNAAGAMVEIYDATGKTVVKEQRLGTNKATFALPQRGMYIVRLGNTAKKILVR